MDDVQRATSILGGREVSRPYQDGLSIDEFCGFCWAVAVACQFDDNAACGWSELYAVHVIILFPHHGGGVLHIFHTRLSASKRAPSVDDLALGVGHVSHYAIS